MIIGIDLGTTNSAAAYLTSEGPQLVPNALGETLTPSVVALDDDGNLLVGRAAKEYQVLRPQRCAAVFKRHMGSNWSTTLAEQFFSAEQLSSLVLRTLKADAEAHLQQPIDQAVISVPAYFNEPQRKATLQAGRMAGFDVRRIINEPTAAALAYGIHRTNRDMILAVVDLGGGTFDVSIADLFEGSLEIRASAGETFLGGEDFTRAIAARVIAEQGLLFERAELEHPQYVSRIIHQSELAKCRLSQHDAAQVRIPDETGDLSGQQAVTVTRPQFVHWTEQILTRIELPIRRALADAKLRPGDLEEVILVGGATRMPMFVDRIRSLLGREPRADLSPDEVVALGAAVQAGLVARHETVSDLVVTDVAPFTLGVEVSKKLGHEHRPGYFLPIIHRNTTIPVSQVERICTIHPDQTCIRVKVFQGEHRHVDKNVLLGEFEVNGIPKGPPAQPVDIRFTYDLNGVLDVDAVIVTTQKKVNRVITRHVHGLTDAELARAVQEMQKFKLHPREDAPNRLTLRRAERLYLELPLTERQFLSELLDGFEDALESGDLAGIERHRANLDMYLDRWDCADQEEGSQDD